MIKNIIIICDYAYIEGGASKVAIQTALALSRQTNLKIFFLSGYGEICDDLKNSNVIVKNLNMYDLLGNPNKLKAAINGIYNKKAERELRKLLLTLNIEETVVHIHTWTKVLSSSIFKVCNDLGVKTFLTLHDYFLVCPNGVCYNYVKRKACDIKPMSIKCMICNCDSRNYIQKLWRYARQFVQNTIIYKFKNLNYIFISEFQVKQIEKRYSFIKNKFLIKNIIDLGEKFKVDCENNNYFLFLGRVCKEKGINLFCEAVRKANVSGIVIGDGPLLDNLKKQYAEIKFVGWQEKEQISVWLKKTRAFVFPSICYEGSPLSIPEVQAHGIPCLVTDGNAGTDNIIPNINGLIVEANVYEIEKGIEQLKNSNFIKKLSTYTFENFDFTVGSEDKYVKSLLELYGKKNVNKI